MSQRLAGAKQRAVDWVATMNQPYHLHKWSNSKWSEEVYLEQ
jgi:hypothetical protein